MHHSRTGFAASILLLTAACCATASHAQSVALTGILGHKALLVINGSAPKVLAVHESYQGVRLLAVEGEQVIIEHQGQRQTVHLGASPTSVGPIVQPGVRQIVLRADRLGHFRGSGWINQQPMQYMVDTGASVIGIGLPDAQRMGIDYRQGQAVTLRTANGTAQGWQLKLQSVRVGDITLHGVAAVVSPQPMPQVLLGNSFLSQLHMHRQGNEMVLQQR